MDTDQSEEELKQVVLHVSEIEKVEVKQGHTSKRSSFGKIGYTRSRTRSYTSGYACGIN